MSDLDWTMTQSLEGGTVEAQAYDLHSKLETKLACNHEKLVAECAELEKRRETAKAAPMEPESCQESLDDLWPQVILSFAICVASLRRAEQACKAFALRHGLPRAVMVSGKVESLLQIALYVVIETLLNAGFLNNAYMVAGPTEAIFGAGLISLTNVAVSTAGGYYIGRYLGYGLHTAQPRELQIDLKRWSAWFGLAVFVPVIGLFHLTVGLIRAQETLSAIEHSPARYLEILTTPEALFLVLVGIVLSAISWTKGLTAFGDPYPGYGQANRNVEDNRADLEDAREDFSNQIIGRIDAKIEGLNCDEKDARKQRTTYNGAVQRYRSKASRQDCAISQAKSTQRATLGQIAQHHRAARGYQNVGKVEIPPDLLPDFEQYRAPDPPGFLALPDYSAQRAELAKAKSEALERLSQLFEQAFNPNQGEPS